MCCVFVTCPPPPGLAAPASIGLNVFVVTTAPSGRRDASHAPRYVSLRPPPYASAVSNVVMPASHAASRIANASSCDSPCPKRSGAEPMPPKLPQPRMTRETSIHAR
jgi:hypothetical protein